MSFSCLSALFKRVTLRILWGRELTNTSIIGCLDVYSASQLGRFFSNMTLKIPKAWQFQKRGRESMHLFFMERFWNINKQLTNVRTKVQREMVEVEHSHVRDALGVIDCFQIQSTEVKPHWGIDSDFVVTSRRDHVDVCVSQWMNKTIRGRHFLTQIHTFSLSTSQHTSKRKRIDWVHISGPLPQRGAMFQIALHTAPGRPTHRS